MVVMEEEEEKKSRFLIFLGGGNPPHPRRLPSCLILIRSGTVRCAVRLHTVLSLRFWRDVTHLSQSLYLLIEVFQVNMELHSNFSEIPSNKYNPLPGIYFQVIGC